MTITGLLNKGNVRIVHSYTHTLVHNNKIYNLNGIRISFLFFLLLSNKKYSFNIIIILCLHAQDLEHCVCNFIRNRLKVITIRRVQNWPILIRGRLHCDSDGPQTFTLSFMCSCTSGPDF